MHIDQVMAQICSSDVALREPCIAAAQSIPVLPVGVDGKAPPERAVQLEESLEAVHQACTRADIAVQELAEV
jgi:hypothetical protein